MRMRWGRLNPAVRAALGLLALALALLLADAACYQVTLPVTLDVRESAATLRVGSQTLAFAVTGHPIAFQLAPHDPLIHEYQLDDTDATNNLTLDLTYLARIAPSPYYRFQTWMRDLDGTSQWRDVRITAGGRSLANVATPTNGQRWTLAPPVAGQPLSIALALQRPETPRALSLETDTGDHYLITLDRNNRRVNVIASGPDMAADRLVASAFFPEDAGPFAAMVLDLLVRALFWAVLLLLLVTAGDAYLALVRIALGQLAGGRISKAWLVARGRWRERDGGEPPRWRRGISGVASGLREWASKRGFWSQRPPALAANGSERSRPATGVWRLGSAALDEAQRLARRRWQTLTAALHPLALAALAGSLALTGWIARVEYGAAPHIYDASAYLFMAKVYAAGRLWAPTPPTSVAAHFPGPFMVQFQGKWFAHYVPGTSVALALGLKAGLPWLVEPLLGTLALLGIGLIAARLYDRRTATLAVLLGTLSPFYTFLAASYMSHAVTLCLLVWGCWAVLRFAQGGRGWLLPFAAVCFSAAALTRELVPQLFAVLVVPGLLLLSRRRLRQVRPKLRDWGLPLLATLSVILLATWLQLLYNAALTGDPLITTRALFDPSDHFGFGTGVGFYGRHTPAAGLVNLDELLTSLAIDLYGWPFYLTLAPLAIPFLTRRARLPDWLLLGAAAVMTGAYIGFFYHGIYLGPRFLYETLPFLLMLSARGVLSLGAAGRAAAAAVRRWLIPLPAGSGSGPSAKPSLRASVRPVRSVAAPLAIAILLACGLLYYWPRQLELHAHFTGLPTGHLVALDAIYSPPVHHAVVVTTDAQLYGYTLFALNDPFLRGDVVYAYSGDPGNLADLRRAFPGRQLYLLLISPTGSVTYVPL